MKSVSAISSSPIDMFDRPTAQRLTADQFSSSSEFALQRYQISQRCLGEACSCRSDRSIQSPVSSANSSPTSFDPYEFDRYELDLNWNEFFGRESTSVLNGHTARSALTSLVNVENCRCCSNELAHPLWQPAQRDLKMRSVESSNEFDATAFENLMELAERTWCTLVQKMKGKSKKAAARSSKGAKCCTCLLVSRCSLIGVSFGPPRELSCLP